MSQVRSITTRSGILFFGKIIDAFFMFVFNLLAAKFIGAEGYGTYVYVSTLIMFLAIGIKLGMDHGLTAMLPSMRDDRREKELVSFSVYCLLAISLVLGILFIFGADFIADTVMNNPNLKQALVLFVPLMFPISFVQMSEGIFRSVGGIKHFFIGKNIIMPISLVGFFLFRVIWLKDVSVESLIFSNYFAWTINVFYLVGVLLKRRILVGLSRSNAAFFKKLMVISIPLIFVGLIEFLMGRIDAYVIGYKLTEVDVGVYSIVDKLAYIGNFMFITGGSMMAPVLARYYADGNYEELRSTYFAVNRWILIINTAVFGGLMLLGHQVLALFGPDFMVGDGVLYALSFAQLINAFFGPLTFLNAMVGLEKVEWRIGMGMLILNTVLDIVVSEPFGIHGVAVVSIFIYLIGNIIRMWWFNKRFGISLVSLSGFKIILLGVMAYLPVAFALKNNPFSGFMVTFILFGATFSLLYLGLVWIWGLNRLDRQNLKKVIFRKNQ